MPIRRTPLLLTILFLFLGVSACSKVGPDYQPVETVAASSWQAPMTGGLQADTSEPQILAAWWTILDDPQLSSFINQAVVGNLDLQQARSRLLAARVRSDISGAGLLPSLTGSGSATKGKSSENRGGGTTSTSYSSGFDAGWEIDLFGGRQRALEASTAQLAASEEDLRDILVSLVAEVALNSIEVRIYQRRLQIAADNLRAQEETLALTRARRQSGLIGELDLQQATSLVASTRAQIPTLQTGLAQAANQLSVLLGLPPGSLAHQLDNSLALPVLPQSILVGIPAETLQRRPDVRRAERQLAAQTAQIGVASAEKYPALKISGSIGLDALSAGKLFTSGSSGYSFGPSLSWTLFDGGATGANIRLQTFLAEEALGKYKATVLSALEEVEGALVAYAQEQERYQALQDAATAAEEGVRLAELQYQAGLVNFTAVLDGRRSQLSFQDQLAQSSGVKIGNFIRLYKALGGGWASLPSTSSTPDGK
jgi:NodT family efflux transporter outer membrane factor (OMF) lipoprotein